MHTVPTTPQSPELSNDLSLPTSSETSPPALFGLENSIDFDTFSFQNISAESVLCGEKQQQHQNKSETA